MRRDEISAAAEGAIAVLPVGSLEQHGRHLPVGTDSLLAEAVSREAADRAAERGVDVVVFPTIWTGFAPQHVASGGTVTLEKETVLALLEEVVESIAGMGFGRILAVNGHGGNSPITSIIADDLGVRLADVEIAEVTYFELAADVMEAVRAGESGSAYHAGEFETALMLYLHEELVDLDAAVDDPVTPPSAYSPRDMFEGGPLGTRRSYDRITEDGTRGEPTLATAAAGERLFETICDELADVLAAVADLE
jgi:creatinine amidohydrolase